MRKIVAGKLQTGADFEGSKGGCVCSGSVAVANSHRKNCIRCKKTSYRKGRFVIESPFFFLGLGKNLLCKNGLIVSRI